MQTHHRLTPYLLLLTAVGGFYGYYLPHGGFLFIWILLFVIGTALLHRHGIPPYWNYYWIVGITTMPLIPTPYNLTLLVSILIGAVIVWKKVN